MTTTSTVYYQNQPFEQVSCSVDHRGAPCEWAHYRTTGEVERELTVTFKVPRWAHRLVRWWVSR